MTNRRINRSARAKARRAERGIKYKDQGLGLWSQRVMKAKRRKQLSQDPDQD